MKKILISLLALALMITAVACGNSDDNTGDDIPDQDTVPEVTQPDDSTDTGAPEVTDPAETGTPEIPEFDYENSDLTAYIKLGQYEGLNVTIDYESITDEEYDAEVAALLESYAYTPYIKEDRPVQEGDTITASYAGYRDGELVNNTSSSNSTISISANSGYIPGFAEGFIGHKVGEVFDFDVTFPEDYHSESLAGVTLTFTGSVIGIFDGADPIPPSLEEFVSDFTDFESIDAFHTYYRTYLNEGRYIDALSKVYDLLWKMVLEDTEVIAYPDNELERIYNMHVETYKVYAEQYGVDYDTFLKDYANLTPELLYDNVKRYIKEDLLLHQLTKVLEIELTEEEYKAGCELYASQYGISVEEFLKYYDEDTVRMSMIYEKIVIELAERANIEEKE